MKKTLALLLVACLALTMIPFMAFAAEEDTTPEVVEPEYTLVGTYADYADYSQYPECFTELKNVYKNLSANKQALVTNYKVIENYDNEYKAYTELGTVDYREYLIQNFKSSEWTKVSGSDVTFGKLGDISDVISYKKLTGVYTAGTFELGNEFHLNFTEFHENYNTNADTYLGFYVGNLFFKVDLSSSSGTNYNAVIRLYNGSELVASSESTALAKGNGASAVSTEFAANYPNKTDNYKFVGGRYNIDYVDGAVTVTLNGTKVLTAEGCDVDLSAAELKFDYKCYYKTTYVYHFNLSAAPTTVNLSDLNREIEALANVTDFSTYSSLAKTVDAVIDQISEDKLAAMYNLGIYENYKLNYSLCQKNYTYNLVKGFYTSDWKSCINGNTSKISYVRNDSYPTGAISFNNASAAYKVVLANKLYTSNYFKVSAKHNYYDRDTYVEYSVGELKIRLMNDRNNDSSAVVTETLGNLTLNVYMNDALIYSASTKAREEGCSYKTLPGSHDEGSWYYARGWTFTYNNGLLTPVYDNGDCKLTAIDLTACEGWNSSYTPNGKEVSFTVYQDYGNSSVTGLNVIGRVNMDAVEAIDALAESDAAAAKNIYDTLNEGAKAYLSDATNAVLMSEFTYSGENATVTETSEFTTRRYGDTVTLTATADEKYDFTGWYDADGNLLTADAAYSVKVMPGVSATAKASCLKFSGASLTLQDNISVNYKVPKSLFDTAGNNYTNPYVVFTMRDTDTIVTDYKVLDDKYVFTFSDIAPHLMNETIKATLHAKYGEEERSFDLADYSIKTYCVNTLEYYSSDDPAKLAKLRTLIVDLMNYGAESQTYKGYKTDNLVNASLTEEQAAWGTAELSKSLCDNKAKTTVCENPSVTWKSAGLNLKESVRLRFKFAAKSIDGLTVKVTDGADKVLTISYDSFVPITDEFYYVYVVGLNAAQMRELAYVTVYNGETAVSDTICYSIESYAYAKLTAENGDKQLKNLLTAMMKYGDSAKAYIS